MSYSFLLKFIVIGDSGVGKSCLLLQYTDQRYRQKHQITIGVEFGAKMIRARSNNIKLQIWDTAGQQSFKAITRGYYRNAVGAIVCYDVSNRQSFSHIAKWLQQAKSHGPNFLNFVLVGNKSDKQAEQITQYFRRKITFQEGLRFAKENGIPFLESSAMDGTNVQEIFSLLTESVLNKIQEAEIDPKTHPGVKIGNQKYVSSKEGFALKQNIQSKNLILIREKQTKKRCCKS